MTAGANLAPKLGRFGRTPPLWHISSSKAIGPTFAYKRGGTRPQLKVSYLLLTWNELDNPWFVAAWPGAGQVGLSAARYLVNHLDGLVSPIHPPTEFCEIQRVTILNGLASADASHAELYAWKDPRGHQDLVIFTDQSPPSSGTYRYSAKAIKHALHRGIARLITFASIVAKSAPAGGPHAVATKKGVLRELADLGVNIISDGSISGLHGATLAAAEKHGLDASCLIGEVPDFSTQLPNPTATHAILDVFVQMAGISLDFTDLDAQVALAKGTMEPWINKSKPEAVEQGIATPGILNDGDNKDDKQDNVDDEHRLDPLAQRRIEALFEQAGEDRSKAGELKAELDRHRIFAKYEDRFLDLFKKSE